MDDGALQMVVEIERCGHVWVMDWFEHCLGRWAMCSMMLLSWEDVVDV